MPLSTTPPPTTTTSPCLSSASSIVHASLCRGDLAAAAIAASRSSSSPLTRGPSSSSSDVVSEHDHLASDSPRQSSSSSLAIDPAWLSRHHQPSATVPASPSHLGPTSSRTDSAAAVIATTHRQRFIDQLPSSLAHCPIVVLPRSAVSVKKRSRRGWAEGPCSSTTTDAPPTPATTTRTPASCTPAVGDEAVSGLCALRALTPALRDAAAAAAGRSVLEAGLSQSSSSPPPVARTRLDVPDVRTIPPTPTRAAQRTTPSDDSPEAAASAVSAATEDVQSLPRIRRPPLRHSPHASYRAANRSPPGEQSSSGAEFCDLPGQSSSSSSSIPTASFPAAIATSLPTAVVVPGIDEQFSTPRPPLAFDLSLDQQRLHRAPRSESHHRNRQLRHRHHSLPPTPTSLSSSPIGRTPRLSIMEFLGTDSARGDDVGGPFDGPDAVLPPESSGLASTRLPAPSVTPARARHIRSSSHTPTSTISSSSSSDSSSSTSAASAAQSELRVEIRLDPFASASHDGVGSSGHHLDMLGSARTGACYSLAGHIILHVPAHLATTYSASGEQLWRLNVAELELVFEGKTEYWDDQGRYEAIKIVDVRKNLLESALRPQELAGGSSYALAFDLGVPGWLPPTCESQNVSTSYGLFCRARLAQVAVMAMESEVTMAASAPVPIAGASILAGTPSRLLPRLAKTLGLSSFRAPAATSSNLMATTFTPVAIARHRITSRSPFDDDCATPLRHFTLKPDPSLTISPVECVVSVPEIVDIGGENVRVSVRLRARPESERGEDVDMDAASTSVRVVEIGMEVEESIRTSSTPFQNYTSVFPLPPSSTPSSLISPPSAAARRALPPGLRPAAAASDTQTRTLLLGEDGEPRTYHFHGGGLELGDGWRKVNIIVPLPSASSPQPEDDLRPSVDIESPFLRIKHKCKIKLVCRSRQFPGQDTIVVLTTPLRCGTRSPVARALSSGSESSAMSDATATGTLPAYCTIFHESGAPREDGEPLPLYRPPASAPAALRSSPPQYRAGTLAGDLAGRPPTSPPANVVAPTLASSVTAMHQSPSSTPALMSSGPFSTTLSTSSIIIGTPCLSLFGSSPHAMPRPLREAAIGGDVERAAAADAVTMTGDARDDDFALLPRQADDDVEMSAAHDRNFATAARAFGTSDRGDTSRPPPASTKAPLNKRPLSLHSTLTTGESQPNPAAITAADDVVDKNDVGTHDLE